MSKQAAKHLQGEDVKKVRHFIEIIGRYYQNAYVKHTPEGYGEAVLALRMLWEVLYTYQSVDGEGIPVIRSIMDKDKQRANARNNAKRSGQMTDASGETQIVDRIGQPYEEVWLSLCKLCHYQPGDEERTNEGRRDVFASVVNGSKVYLGEWLAGYTEPGDALLGEFNTVFQAYWEAYTDHNAHDNATPAAPSDATAPKQEQAQDQGTSAVYTDRDASDHVTPTEPLDAATRKEEQARKLEGAYVDFLCARLNDEHLMDRVLKQAYYTRYLAEMLLRKRLESRIKDIGSGKEIANTNFGDFVKELGVGRPNPNSDPKIDDKSLIDRDYSRNGEIISYHTKWQMHWRYSENDDETRDMNRTAMALLSGCMASLTTLLTMWLGDRQGLDNVAAFIRDYRANDADRAWQLIQMDYIQREKKLDEINAALGQKLKVVQSNDRWTTCCLLVVLLLFVAYLGYRKLTIFNLPGDPAPAIVEQENLVAEEGLDEIPTITARLGDVTLTEGQVTVLPYAQDRAEFRVQAVCNAPRSLKWAQNARYMGTRGYAPNAYGLGLLQYQVFESDSQGQRVGNSTRFNSTVRDGCVNFQYELAPGWYVLRVQAVGAADGLTVDGVELNASTGWRSYPFLVLPEAGDWSLRDANRGTYADGDDSLSVKAGDELELICNAELADGMRLYASWDSDGEWGEYVLAEGGRVTVPDLDSGVYSLRVDAKYADATAEYPAGLHHEFNCAVEAKTVIESNVQLSVQTANGRVIADGDSVVLAPGEKLNIRANGRYGIERLYCEMLHDGESLGSWTEEIDAVDDLKVNGEYGAINEIRCEAVGNGNSGYDDKLNRASIQFEARFRTEKDEYDADGQCVKEWLYANAESNEPTGYILREYEDERVLSTSYWTADGAPAYGDGGYHERRNLYTDDGQWAESWLYDLDGKSLMEGLDLFDGAAGLKVKYDQYGYQSENWNYGADRKLRENNEEYAGWIHVHDERGNILSETYYGENGEPTLRDVGYCVYKSVYDDDDNEIDAWLYDTDSKTLIDSEFYGYAHHQRSFDGDGNQTSDVCYHADGSPVVRDGYVQWEAEYYPGSDDLKYKRYLDAEGHPVNHEKLLYSRVEEVHEQGLFKEQRFYDADGNPVNSSDGYARQVREYNPDNQQIERIAYYDAAGQLVVPQGQQWAMVTYKYKGDHCVEERYYRDESALVGVDGLLGAAIMKSDYNAEGNRTYYFFYDAQEQPFAPDGRNYCGSRHIYEPGSGGRVYYTFYLDERGEPIVNELGFYKAKITQDAHGRAVREERMLEDGSAPAGDTVRTITWEYFDESSTSQVKTQVEYSEPREGACSQTRREYDVDPLGEVYLKAVSYYDGNGAPVRDTDGIWMYSYERKAKAGDSEVNDLQAGGEVRVVYTKAYYDAPDHLVLGPEGYARMEYEADGEAIASYFDVDVHNGNLGYDPSFYEERYYGTDGRLMLNRERGYSTYRRTITTMEGTGSAENTEEYFDTAGNPMVNERVGYAKKIQEYQNDRLVRQEFYGADGKPMRNPRGFAMERWEYDGEGNLLRHSFHDETFADDPDNPLAGLVMNEYGTYALEEGEYEGGQLVLWVYRNAEGKPMVNPDQGYAYRHIEYGEDGRREWFADENDEMIDNMLE